MNKIRINSLYVKLTIVYLVIISLCPRNTHAQELKNSGGVHYSFGSALSYTEFSLLGANLFYEYKFNASFSLRSCFNINYYDFIRPNGYCSSVGSLGNPKCLGKLVEFERLSSSLFFSIDESINYYFNHENNYLPYLGLGVGYFIFDNYLTNHPRANISEEELKNSIGYHFLAGLIHQQSGFSFYIKYILLPANLIQYQYVGINKLNRIVYLNIINFNIGYTF